MRKNADYRRPRHPKFSTLDRCSTTGKVRYKDHRMATEFLHHFKNIAIESIETLGYTSHQEKRSYKCKSCNGWHLTSWAEDEYKKFALAA